MGFLSKLEFICLSNYIGLFKHSVISAVTNFSTYPFQLNPEHGSIFIIPEIIIHAFYLFPITEQIKKFISNLAEDKLIQK